MSALRPIMRQGMAASLLLAHALDIIPPLPRR